MAYGSFYTIIDVATLNGYIVMINNTPQWNARLGKRRRRQYILNLGMELVKPWIEQRSTIGLQSDIRLAMSTILERPVEVEEQPVAHPDNSRGKCHVCIKEAFGEGYRAEKKNANKVKQSCSRCLIKTCKKTHSKNTYLHRLPVRADELRVNQYI